MRKLLIGTVLALAATTARAEIGFYLGAGVSQSDIDGFEENFEIDETAWKAIVGFRPIDLLAVELNYMDLGSTEEAAGPLNFEADATAISGFVLGYLPIPVPIIDVYAKAGLAYWELDGSLRSALTTIADLDESGTEFAYGAGAQLNFGGLSLRLEYEKFDIENTDGLDLYTLGATWTFL